MTQPSFSRVLTRVFLLAVSFSLMALPFHSTALSQASEESKEKDQKADVLYLNLNAQGELLVAGRNEPLKTEEAIKDYLCKRFADARNAAKANGDEEVRAVLIIRASKDVDFNPVRKLLQEAKAVGFRQCQLRAVVAEPEAKEAAVAPAKPAQVPTELTVRVTTSEGKNEGSVSSITVQSAEADIGLRSVEALNKYLTAKQKDLANQEAINIVADGKLKYLAVIEVMDACLQAGFTKVGFLPPPDMGK